MMFKFFGLVLFFCYGFFLFIDTNTLDLYDSKDGNYQVFNKSIKTFNSIKNISIIKDTKDELYKEANFDNTKKLTADKEGFQRDVLFFFYVKKLSWFLCKVALFFFLIFLFIKTAKSIFTK